MTAPQTGRIFISYRRDDSAGYAGRIYDRLAAHFGKDSIFMDVDTIEAGLDFVEVLENAVQSCDVLVALIGRLWLEIKDTGGKRRLDNPQDFVHIEVTAALNRGIRVIPVLVDGTPMPNSDQLPSTLKSLARRNAVLVNHYSFHNDANRLIEQLELALKAAEESKILKAKELKEKEAQEKHQAEIENLLSQADIALDLQGWELAKEKLEAVITLDPEHVQAQVKLAIVQRKLRETFEQNLAEEKAAKEKAEQERKERERLEHEENVRKEKAEREAVERAYREELERLQRERIIREQEEKEVAEKAAREKDERERLAREKQARKEIVDMAGREQTERDSSEKVAPQKSTPVPGFFQRIKNSSRNKMIYGGIFLIVIAAFIGFGAWGINAFLHPGAATAELTPPGQPAKSSQPEQLAESIATEAPTTTEQPSNTFAVGIVLPTKDEPRWIQDETRFKDALTKAGYDVQILFSQGDSAKEKANVESLISQNIKVLILTPQDGAAAAAAAEEARAAGVKVISYDRLILNTDAVDYYVTFDSIAVGAAQGQYLVDKASGTGNPLYLYAGAASDNNAFLFFQGAWNVLQPKIADGTFVIKNSSEAVGLQDKAELTRDEEGKIIGQITTNWDFNTAKSLAESNLTATTAADKGNVFILAPNDGTARAIADAFAADKDVSSYVVTGQDAEEASIQYIIDGKQSMTVLKDVRTLVADAISAAVAFLEGKTPPKTTTYNNGKIDVPAKPSEVISVDQSNLKAAIIDSGYWPASDFTGIR